MQAWLWEGLKPLLVTSRSSATASYRMKPILHFRIRLRNGLPWLRKRKRDFICSQLKAPQYRAYHPTNLLQMLRTGCRMDDAGAFGNFSCGCRRSAQSAGSSAPATVDFWEPTYCTPSLSRLLVSFTKLPEQLLHCMFVSSSQVRRVTDVASCLC